MASNAMSKVIKINSMCEYCSIKSINHLGLTWLHWAVIGGTECFTALMDETTVQLRDKGGRTAFLFAAEKGCIEPLKVMRERVSSERLFDTDNHGRTALHLATMNGQGRIAGFLLDCGCKF